MAAQLQVARNSPIVDAANAARGVMSEAGTVEVLHRGEQYRAAYSVKNGMVHILTTLGRKPPRPPGGSPPQAVARLMLKELLHERDAQTRRR
jgi:hypothetical protein